MASTSSCSSFSSFLAAFSTSSLSLTYLLVILFDAGALPAARSASALAALSVSGAYDIAEPSGTRLVGFREWRQNQRKLGAEPVAEPYVNPS